MVRFSRSPDSRVKAGSKPTRPMPTNTETVCVPAGEYRTMRLALESGGPATRFDTAVNRPCRLVRYVNDSAYGEPAFVERRDFGDPSSLSFVLQVRPRGATRHF